MPIWLIEIFGAKELDGAFVFMALMTAPFWAAMIFFPRARWVVRIAQPWLIAPLYAVILVVLLWKSYEASLLPKWTPVVSYESAKALARHPVAFLVLFCNLQTINLFMGTMIYQKANRCGFRAPVELMLCWFFGALVLIPFSLRLVLRRQASV